MSNSSNEDLIELETGMNLLIRPSKLQMKAIVNKDYELYSIPCYQHYNWCLNYLRINKPFVTWETADYKLEREDLEQVRGIMISACIKYLGETLSNFTKADFNTITNYLEHLEGIYYKTRTHVDPEVRKNFSYDEKIMSVYLVKERAEFDFEKGLFKDE